MIAPTVFFVILQIMLCRADISEISAANTFEGYDYSPPVEYLPPGVILPPPTPFARNDPNDFELVTRPTTVPPPVDRDCFGDNGCNEQVFRPTQPPTQDRPFSLVQVRAQYFASNPGVSHLAPLPGYKSPYEFLNFGG